MSGEKKHPPEKAKWLLVHLADYRERFNILEEMEEAFHEIGSERGYRKARSWYWSQSFSALLNYFKYFFSWSLIMIKNYLISSLRNMKRQKIFSIVNILGLSLGLACCLLIYLFIVDEISFDRFHEKGSSIYGVVSRDEFHNSSGLNATMGTGPVIQEDFPEVKYAVRIYERQQAAVKYGDKIFNENPIFTDSSFFLVFSFSLLAGNPETVLQYENSVVLTRRAAEKYFGQGSSLGETISMTFDDIKKDFFVSGICENPPYNSTLDFDFLVNIENLKHIRGEEYMTNLRWFDVKIFVLLNEGASPGSVNQRFPVFIKEYYKETLQRRRESDLWKGEKEVISFHLENIRDLHLNPLLRNIGSRSIQSSLILAGIGILILIIACINFINLSIGSASTRSIEAGIRRVLGAQRKHMLHQFWTESLILTFIAMFIGLVLAQAYLPIFNNLAEKNLSIGSFFTLTNLLIFLVLIIVVGIASGCFPGVFFSQIDPVSVFKSQKKWGRKSSFSRGLVVFQFSLAVFLMVVTFFMARQFRYVNQADLGFDQEGIIVVDLQESEFDLGKRTEELIERFRSELIGQPNIKQISGSIMGFNRWLVMNHIDIKGTTYDVFFNRVTFDYLKTMGIKLVDGRDFSRDFSLNPSSILVNQSFIERYGFDDPIGQTISPAYERDKPLTIIGIVEDFHFQSLKHKIEPLILHMLPETTIRDLLVRVDINQLPDTVRQLEDVWKSICPDKPFLFSFLSQDVKDAYDHQRRWNMIVGFTTILAVFISCLGIFALTVISITRRVKEIGIRKVLGARTGRIIALISREFMILVAAANIIAWPVAYYVSKRWLQGFAYRIHVGPDVFLFVLGLSLLISMATVGLLALKAASSNPVDSLRTE